MSNKLKKIISTTAAAGIAALSIFGTALSGSAAQITVPSSDTHSYKVYQIFTGDYSATDGSLSNIKYGADSGKTVGDAVPLTDINALEALASQTDKQILAGIDAFVDLDSATARTVSSASAITDAAPGYYLIKDESAIASTDYDSYTLYIVKVLGESLEIARKSALPTIDKTIKVGSTYVEADDAAYGDTVNFRIVGTLPDNFDAYSTYKYQFNDVHDDNITYDDSTVKVFVDGTDKTDAFTVNYDADAKTLTVSIDDIKTIDGISKDSVVSVEFSGTLKDGAAYKTDTYAELVFSNNPNNGEETATATTPEDHVYVYNYKLLISKVGSGSSRPALEGAKFALYKVDGNDETLVSEIEGKAPSAGAKANLFEWDGLDSGDYKIVETQTPSGYNTIDPIEFTIERNFDGDTGALTALTGGDFTGNAADGSLSGDVVNIAGAKLPTTGTVGIIILSGGAAFLLGGAALLKIKNKKEDEE